jgi:hypothetical protein
MVYPSLIAYKLHPLVRVCQLLMIHNGELATLTQMSKFGTIGDLMANDTLKDVKIGVRVYLCF